MGENTECFFLLQFVTLSPAHRVSSASQGRPSSFPVASSSSETLTSNITLPIGEGFRSVFLSTPRNVKITVLS